MPCSSISVSLCSCYYCSQWRFCPLFLMLWQVLMSTWHWCICRCWVSFMKTFAFRSFQTFGLIIQRIYIMLHLAQNFSCPTSLWRKQKEVFFMLCLLGWEMVKQLYNGKCALTTFGCAWGSMRRPKICCKKTCINMKLVTWMEMFDGNKKVIYLFCHIFVCLSSYDKCGCFRILRQSVAHKSGQHGRVADADDGTHSWPACAREAVWKLWTFRPW